MENNILQKQIKNIMKNIIFILYKNMIVTADVLAIR